VTTTTSGSSTRKTSDPLDRPPESLRPDRPEVVRLLGATTPVQIEPGVHFECHVGTPNHARNLTTGLVTFEPGAALRLHTHPFSESITLLTGHVAVNVQGRRHELEQYDNVVIPRELPHFAQNLSTTSPCVVHIAMASHAPTRTIIDRELEWRVIPATELDASRPERVNRFRIALRFSAGPNTEFIDFFNNDLLPGIEMSGGYGLFHPGGRLPAHFHDFDESISIISGESICIVEGRQYKLSGCATAMVPRGRVHYFKNESGATMEMLWVYAGPMPERIVVHERCATPEGDPWK
jgi:quercetin dioxygenase-like cupin family protein